MQEEQKRQLSVSNASGYPFQMAVAASVKRAGSPWRVLVEEHPYRHPETGRDGYIDVVLQQGRNSSEMMVVECKRQREGRWYFLNLGDETALCRMLVTKPSAPQLWAEDVPVRPLSPEAAVCILPGEDASRRPSLERLCDELLQSVEALAIEQLEREPDPFCGCSHVVSKGIRSISEPENCPRMHSFERSQ